MYPPLCAEELGVHSYLTPPTGASLFPQRPRQDQRDAGVSAAVWGGTGGSIIADPSPRGVPIPQVDWSEP